MSDSTSSAVRDDAHNGPLTDNLVSVMHFIEERAGEGQPFCGLRTGFKQLDLITQGLMAGELTVVAGRPSAGKTTFAVSVASNVTATADKPSSVLFFSTDHTKEDITLRFLSARSSINFKRLRLGRLVDRDWPRLAQAADKLARAPLEVLDAGWLSVDSIRKRIEAADRAGRSPRLVIIDKFYSMTLGEVPQEGSNNRTNEQSQIIVELKALARKHGLSILLLADINKGMEARVDRRPLLVDLKDGSAALESYADHVFLLYRDELYRRYDTEDRGIGEVIVAKTRSDSDQTVRLAFMPDVCLWSELAPEAKETAPTPAAT